MAGNETEPKSRTGTKKKGNLPVLNIITIALSAVAIGVSGLGYLANSSAVQSTDSKLMAIANTVKVKFENLESQAKGDTSQVDTEQVKTIVKDTMQEFYTNNREKIAQDVAPLIPVQSAESLSDSAVMAIVDRYYQTKIAGKLQGIETDAQQAKSSAEYALRRANSAHSELDKVDQRFKDVAKRTVSAASPAYQRLKEFNIIDTVKDGTVFVIEAPLKNGALNTITLMVNESFVSKFGSHKVLSAETVDGKPRLIVSGGYFIDGEREELSEAELAAVKSAKQSRATKPQKQPETRVAKNTEPKRANSQTQLVAKSKMYLPDWKIITPIPESKTVVVYDGMNTVQLQKGKYIQGIGTVKDIDFSTGETCFETYCIAGLK